MQRTNFSEMICPIARSLGRVGEWWSILILRDAFYGFSRFDEFQKSLTIAPNMLARRLNGLVAEGLLEKRPYQARPLRHEYVLTPRGRDFWPVIVALANWGNRHFTPEGRAVVFVDAMSGAVAEPQMIDRFTGVEIRPESHAFAPGPAANNAIRRRYAGAPTQEDR